ncbi:MULTISPECIES: hypothetical protein [Candidatus Nitrosocaldus]|jgi:hypothetical protein|uniref:Uncharacterized protein n=1 Tax=Candidatus Nitrosocaldus cavascurensis TaxID=2058097 RepID=A0A2K5ARS9_9ARCH|nr:MULTISPECIES: hypothetical protein [Candidatus Nitrosocaldus]SPC34309.1 protein of unknown function [Candidatus Nitrosocaldus cavascurensis]
MHKLDDAKTGIINEIQIIRKDIRSVLDERLGRIEEDIAKIKTRYGMIRSNPIEYNKSSIYIPPST